jgi:hypothetical protein
MALLPTTHFAVTSVRTSNPTHISVAYVDKLNALQASLQNNVTWYSSQITRICIPKLLAHREPRLFGQTRESVKRKLLQITRFQHKVLDFLLSRKRRHGATLLRLQWMQHPATIGRTATHLLYEYSTPQRLVSYSDSCWTCAPLYPEHISPFRHHVTLATSP